jgi:hypothetical protein
MRAVSAALAEEFGAVAAVPFLPEAPAEPEDAAEK